MEIVDFIQGPVSSPQPTYITETTDFNIPKQLLYVFTSIPILLFLILLTLLVK